VCDNNQQASNTRPHALSAAVNAVLTWSFRKSIMEKRKRE